MGKNRDLIQILLLIVIGMFIPFIGSIALHYGLNIQKIIITFGSFLLIFGLELVLVFLYFTITNKLANKRLQQHQSLRKHGKR